MKLKNNRGRGGRKPYKVTEEGREQRRKVFTPELRERASRIRKQIITEKINKGDINVMPPNNKTQRQNIIRNACGT